MRVHITIIDEDGHTFDGVTDLTKSKKPKKLRPIEINPKGHTDVIKKLYYQNYFENSRTLNDVEQKIKSKKYNSDLAVIAKTLQRAQYLKQEGNCSGYSYIQKAPLS